MEKPILNDSCTFPTEEVLQSVMGAAGYALYAELIAVVTGPGYGLDPQWNYYRDGGAWLCKVANGKKTVFWLSVWEGHFRVAFYFTEKAVERVLALDIASQIKEDFCRAKPMGRLIPLSLVVSGDNINDILALARYKKSLK